jgi:ABC-type transport system substrate-binding protein
MRFYSFCLLLLSVLATACSSPKPETTGTVRIRWERGPESLDPLELPDEQATETVNLLSVSLLSVDMTSRQWVPALAEALPTIEKKGAFTLATYTIRPQARWDNGRPVLARDVAFTLKMMFCPGLPSESANAMFGFIQDITLYPEQPRKFTLVLEGRAPEYKFSTGDFAIYPEYALDSTGQLRALALSQVRADTVAARTNPVVRAFVQRYQRAELGRHPGHLPGCGPYRLVSNETNRYLIFERKAHWWADTLHSSSSPLRALPRRIEYQIIPDAATALLALRRGDVDVYPMLPAQEFTRLAKSAAAQQDLQFHTSASYTMLTAWFNTRQLALRDKYTRQALSLLFKVPELIQATQNGLAYPSASIVNPTATAYYNDSLPALRFDPARAKALLGTAGWQRTADGHWSRRDGAGRPQPLEVSLSYRTGEPAYEAIALQFRSAAAQLGIPVRMVPLEVSLFRQKLKQGQVDMYLYTLTGNPHVYNFAPILHTESLNFGNFSGFGNAATDHYIEAIAQEEDEGRKARMLRTFQRVLRDEAPVAVLFFTRNRLAASSRLAPMPASPVRPGYEVTALRPALPATR